MKIVYLLQNRGIESSTPAGWQSAVISARPEGGYSEEDLAQVEDADFLVVGLEPLGDEIFTRAKRLKLVQRLGVGHCNVDLDAASRHRVPVCNMPDFNAATVAEHTIMLMLALLRRVFDSTLLMKAGQWPVPTIAAGSFDLQGKTLGLIGYGAIGRAVAVRASAFGVRLCYHDPCDGDRRDEGPDATPVGLDELLRGADIVSIHVPLTAETAGMIRERELDKMKSTAVLINTARGSVVDEAALVRSLQERRIAGAGIDVFSGEPLDAAHPLRRCPNVLLTPHTAGQTREAMNRMVAMMLENIQRVVRGEEPLGVV